ncbi:plasmid mobilization relaxosome protein MobC [uncultured Cycloclasticus sp.]|uniref:plasmid mobilization protein n=1 Tax=uncultured Cycloclasticus sp. TaxID=172194 RepID=UPI00259075B5|nr:plasmid mobilization relaxosome protein MobC [uncultured Cycloclasticus sp.]
MKDIFNNVSGYESSSADHLHDVFNSANGSNYLNDSEQSKTHKKRTAPFSLRLSFNEREELERRSDDAGLSLGGYCKFAIFEKPPPRRARRPVRDRAELAKLLGAVGKVGNNLNQIAQQLNTHGSIDVPELKQALDDLTQIRAQIMIALGYAEDNSASTYPDNGIQRNDH